MVCRLPEFPVKILNETWQNDRSNGSKITLSALSIRCTLAAMCGMHVHKGPGKKKYDIWTCCADLYKQLTNAMKLAHPHASVIPFLDYTANTMVTRMDGEKVFRMSQLVRKECVNVFNPLWKSCLDDSGQPPSGKTWEWVRCRVLILLYRQAKKIETPLPQNAGKFAIKFLFQKLIVVLLTDSQSMMTAILDERPFWGRGQPRACHAFMTFGHGRKVRDVTSEASTWTVTSPTSGARKREKTGRRNQRATTSNKRAKLRADSDAEYVVRY